jgi:citrate lyase subunit beta / citryl-CoA lyase
VSDDMRVDNEASTDQDDADIGSRIDPVLARSWLLVNGAQYERFAPAVRSRADIVVLDIEDAVAPKDKVSARGNVIKWLSEGNGDWVRVNGFGTQWWQDDLEMLSGTSVGGVMLAMVESVDHVTETAKRLPNTPIVALVETARGLERIAEIASSKAHSGSPSVSATSAETPVSATTRRRSPTRGHGSRSRRRLRTCRVR